VQDFIRLSQVLLSRLDWIVALSHCQSCFRQKPQTDTWVYLNFNWKIWWEIDILCDGWNMWYYIDIYLLLFHCSVSSLLCLISLVLIILSKLSYHWLTLTASSVNLNLDYFNYLVNCENLCSKCEIKTKTNKSY
jgi:hypothetical protein